MDILPNGQNNGHIPDLCDAALEYAKQYNWPVFPCDKNKDPLTRHGFKDATTDPEQIRKWWKANPTASIGIPTGAVTGVVVIDQDAKEEGSEEALEALELPPGARVRSGGGGIHAYLAHPLDGEKIKNRAGPNKLRDKLDVRGDGGYIILPPSRHESGRLYEWEVSLNGHLDPIIAELLTELRAETKSSGTGAGAQLKNAEVLDGVPEGGRDDALFRYACSMRGRGHPIEEARVLIREAAERAQPPFDVDEALEKVERAYSTYDVSTKPEHTDLREQYLGANPGVAYGQGEWKRYENGVWLPVGARHIRNAIGDVLEENRPRRIHPTNGMLSSVLELTIDKVFVDSDEWDSDPEILVCENGALHLPTRDLRPHSKDYYATGAVPYPYNPDTVPEAWTQFIGDIDKDVASFLQEFAGYSLTTDTSHELAVWLYGPPGAGRSTFLEGLQAMLGARAGVIGLNEVDRNRFALAGVPGKTLLVASEQPGGYVQNSHILNALISGEPLLIDRKYRDAIEIRPRAKIAWAMNELPRVYGGNNGIFRRVKLVYFPKVEEPDRTLKERIKTEGAGIVNWALDGLARLQARGKFVIPESVQQASEKFQSNNDIAALFVAERCKVGPDKRSKADELYICYKLWCDANGHKPKSHTAVSDDWERLGFEKYRPGGVRYYKGIESNFHSPDPHREG